MSKEPNFTTGRWMVELSTTIVCNDVGDPIADVLGTDDDLHLIKASRDLYEAAEAAFKLLGRTMPLLPAEDPSDRIAFDRLRDALARARGEES